MEQLVVEMLGNNVVIKIDDKYCTTRCFPESSLIVIPSVERSVDPLSMRELVLKQQHECSQAIILYYLFTSCVDLDDVNMIVNFLSYHINEIQKNINLVNHKLWEIHNKKLYVEESDIIE